MRLNISAHTDTQQQDAAARQLLRAGGLQRYSIGYGGYGLVPALCALRLEHLLDAQTWLIEAAEVRFKHQKCL